MLPLQAPWLPAFQQTSQDITRGAARVFVRHHTCVSTQLSRQCYLRSLYTRLDSFPGCLRTSLCATHMTRSPGHSLPTFACCKQRLEIVKAWERGYCVTGLTCLVAPGSHGPSQTCVSDRSSCGKCCKSREQAGRENNRTHHNHSINNGRVSYRILSWGGKQDGSRMIVARWLLGGSGDIFPSPQENLDPLGLLLTQSWTNFPNTY